MKKKKLYMFISVLVIILLFTTSAFCNRCQRKAQEKASVVEEATFKEKELKVGKTISTEKVKVYIPPETQDSQSEILISEVTKSLPPPPQDTDAIGSAYEITSEEELAGPVLVTLSYDPSDLSPDAKEENLYIAILVGNNWEVVPDGFVDTYNYTISAPVEHFSKFRTFLKRIGEALYSTKEALFGDEFTNVNVERLPQQIKNDLENNHLSVSKPPVEASVHMKLSLTTKAASAVVAFANVLNENLDLFAAAAEGTKEAIASAVTDAVKSALVEKGVDYAAGERGTAVLNLYDSAGNIIDYATYIYEGNPTALATNILTDILEKEMDYINRNMDKGYADLWKFNPTTPARVDVYAIFIKSQNAEGIRFYYLNKDTNEWENYYNNMVYWGVDFEPDEELVAKETIEEETYEEEAEEYEDEEFQGSEESSLPEVFDTERLIPYYDCPYEFKINVGENFSRVEVLHYNDEGDTFKYGGWMSWLELNGSLVYEWIEFEEGVDSIWYDHTQEESFYGIDDPDDFSDVTDYIHPGENIITYYHYNEGPGTGIIVRVYY
ncbi:MAG: hypothetical protein H8E13_10490 [Actinobacteria bacterium]|nr:hypothetical protein [Actinomycetota bacterium]